MEDESFRQLPTNKIKVMEKVYVLDYTKDHFTDDLFFDAKFIPFKGSEDIAPTFLVSSQVDLEKATFKFRAVFKNYKERDFLSNNRNWPLFSKDLYDVISKFSLPYKAFNAEVQDQNGKPIEKKFLAVQIDEVSNLVDREKSKFTPDEMFPNSFSIIEKLVFKPKLPALFRIEEYPQLLFITESLKEAIDKAHLKGLEITEVNSYNWNL